MIPDGGTIRNAPIEEEEQPSLTWHMNFREGRITGKIEGIQALKQTVYQILQTERFDYLIYSFNYGDELHRLIGMNPLFVQSEAKRMIREALTQDDRINDIQDIQTEINGDSITIRFRVVSLYGSFQEEQEVMRRV